MVAEFYEMPVKRAILHQIVIRVEIDHLAFFVSVAKRPSRRPTCRDSLAARAGANRPS